MILSNGRVILMKWQVICKSVMIPPMKSSKTGDAFINLWKMGSQATHRNITANTWICASASWFTVKMKMTTFLHTAALEMKFGSNTTIQRGNAKVWNSRVYKCWPNKSSECNQWQEKWCSFVYNRATAVSNSAWYPEMCEKLKSSLWHKHQGFLLKGVVLSHDIAIPHTAIWIVETVWQLHFEVLEHPPYSVDVVPLDCVISWVHSEMLCKATNLPATNWWRNWGMCDLSFSPKLFFLRGHFYFVRHVISYSPGLTV